jgi:hypothetical protein
VLPLHERSMWSVREWSAMNGISVATGWIGKGDLVLSKWRGRSFVTREASDTWRDIKSKPKESLRDTRSIRYARLYLHV